MLTFLSTLFLVDFVAFSAPFFGVFLATSLALATLRGAAAASSIRAKRITCLFVFLFLLILAHEYEEIFFCKLEIVI